MANFFPCPNPACTYQFDADQLPAAAMVTCPICRTRFPYRAAAPSAKAPARDAKQNPFGSGPADGGDSQTAPSPQRERTNRLVNPGQVPKGNKTQTILMIAGFTGVLFTVLAIVFFSMRNNPFRSDGETAETYTDDENNFRFRRFDKSVWTEDKSIRSKMKISGFIQKRTKPDAWFALHTKDFGKKSPRPNEMRTAMIKMLRSGFKLDPNTPAFQATISGQPAYAIQFQGEQAGQQMIGEGYAFNNKGIGYILLYWASNDSWESAKRELKDLAASFEFATARDKWQETESSVDQYFVASGNYQIDDIDGVWERGTVEGEEGPKKPVKKPYILLNMADKDKQATMAFRFKESQIRPVPETIVLVMEKAADPLQAAHDYWFEKLKEDEGRNGEVKIAFEPVKKSPSGMEIPKSDAKIGIYLLENPEDRKSKKFYAIAAMNIGDKLVAAISWCPDREAEDLEPLMLTFIATLKERR